MHSLFKRTRCAAWLALVFAGSGAWAGATLDHIKQSGKIVLAHRESSVPFS